MKNFVVLPLLLLLPFTTKAGPISGGGDEPRQYFDCSSYSSGDQVTFIIMPMFDGADFSTVYPLQLKFNGKLVGTFPVRTHVSASGDALEISFKGDGLDVQIQNTSHTLRPGDPTPFYDGILNIDPRLSPSESKIKIRCAKIG